MLNPINKTIELSDGRTITIETGKLAKQADGAVTVRMGNTWLLFVPLKMPIPELISCHCK
jgi:polyribonucleotide nucleotidyltransferase